MNIPRYEAQECCVMNYGFLAQPSTQAEHDLIKSRLQTSELKIEMTEIVTIDHLFVS